MSLALAYSQPTALGPPRNYLTLVVTRDPSYIQFTLVLCWPARGRTDFSYISQLKQQFGMFFQLYQVRYYSFRF